MALEKHNGQHKAALSCAGLIRRTAEKLFHYQNSDGEVSLKTVKTEKNRNLLITGRKIY